MKLKLDKLHEGISGAKMHTDEVKLCIFKLE